MANETLHHHLAVSYETGIGYGAIADFESELAFPGLVLKTEERPESGPFASLEWLVPTAVMVLIAKPYFDGFLKEAGKDHYHVLKKALSTLGKKFLGKSAPEVQLVYTKGKVLSGKPKYSLVFSIYGEIQPGLRLKLLVKPDSEPNESEEAIRAFLSALISIHEGTYQRGDVIGFDGARPIGGTVLVTFDQNEKRLVVVNPLPNGVRHES